MRFPIKFKIIALGSILSIVVTTVALVFSNYQYRERGKANQLERINGWLDDMKATFGDEVEGYVYRSTIEDGKTYILEQYEASDPKEAPESYSYTQKRLFYKERYMWLYGIEGISMHHMTDEERYFRSGYEEILFRLSDVNTAIKANFVYLCFVTEDNTLFYMGDAYTYRRYSLKQSPYLPGSHLYNFSNDFVLNGNYYDSKYDGNLNRIYDIKSPEGLTVAYLVVQYDFSAVEADANSLMVTEIIALSIASLLLIIAFAVMSHFFISRNISKLTKAALEFAENASGGKPLEVKDPQIKSKDEIKVLSNSFIALEEGIIKYIDVIQKETIEKERTNAELAVATNIQLSALPNRQYDDQKTSIRSFIKSAKEVGGDFYDYFYLDDHRLAIVISDVSGKGVPAALFMMKSKELIKSAIHAHKSLVDATKYVNSKLVSADKDSLFVTSFMGIIDFNKEVINYVNAGHEKPYLISKEKVIKLDGESNFVMGGEEDFEYKEESHSFNKGDSIFLFTDGLNESINDAREEFSYSRIEEVLSANKNLSSQNIIDKMNEALDSFVGNETQFDDVTMMIVKFKDDSLSLSYDKKDYSIIEDIVDKFNENYSYLPNESKAAAGIVIDEAVNNLISYEKREDLKINVTFAIKPAGLEIKIISNGDEFNPFDNHKEKYYEDFNSELLEGGFGTSLIKDFSQEYGYEYQDHQSILWVIIPIK